MATSKNTKTFVDLDLSFKANPFTKDIYLKTDEEAVKTALKHLIQTKNFERPFHPEIGTQVYSLLFENFSPAVRIALERTIRETIEKFETRVRIINVNVQETVESNDLAINIVFALKNTDTPLTNNLFKSSKINGKL
jgi:phage baseplate assembly protein W